MSVTPGTASPVSRSRPAVRMPTPKDAEENKSERIPSSCSTSSVAKGNTEDLAGLAARFWALSQVPHEGDYPTLIDFAMRIIAATLRSTSSSVVAQQETEIRIAVCPCQIVPAHQQVPSA